jgi:hypothetical protein
MKTWRFLTLILTALSMAVAWAHLLEMPAKLKFDGATWLSLLQNLYPPGFGTAGSFFEGGAVITSLVLVFVIHRRPRAFGWALAGTLCVLAAHAAFWIWVAPVNSMMLSLTPETLPADWTRFRDQWEYTHAVRAVLQLVAVGAFVLSMLTEIPNGTAAVADRTPGELETSSRMLGLRVAGTLFGLFSLAQLARLIIRPDILVASHALPLWPSALAFIVLAGLSVWMWRLARPVAT